MKLVHNIKVKVFSNSEDDKNKVLDTLKSLFPFDLEKEKRKINSNDATGFEDKKISILEITIDKARHTNSFLKNLNLKLNKKQKELLIKQIESRLDENLIFYIRLDKNKLLNREYSLTDTGNCFHISLPIACYPKSRETALVKLKEIFK